MEKITVAKIPETGSRPKKGMAGIR